jgi:hypothetical protein
MTLIRSGQPAAATPGSSPVNSATCATGSPDSSTGRGVGQGKPDRELDGQAALFPEDAQMRQPRLGGAGAVGANQDRRAVAILVGDLRQRLIGFV